MSNDISKIRVIRANSTLYLRLEDVVEYVRQLGVGEETDVRNRLNEAALNIHALTKR